MLIISIEGNIGAGKSTLWSSLQNVFAADDGVIFVEEPVQEWDRLGFLNRMYMEPQTRPMFQLMVLTSLTCDLLEAVAKRPRVIITERSPWGNYHTFAKHVLCAEDLVMYEFTWRKVVQMLPCVKPRFIYLTAPVASLQQRMQTRGRVAEASVSCEYLRELAELHDEWLGHEENVHRVDASVSRAAVLALVLGQVHDWMSASLPDEKEHENER